MRSFTRKILHWYPEHGRQHLPWQNSNAYQRWLSEIMLQQTQVATVIPYFQRFIAQFPDVATLANAEQDEVLHLWSGLGYYARARNLHKAAKEVCAKYQGQFPADVTLLETLPGIGRSTAGAIASLALDQRAAILDGNVKRVLARHHAVGGYPGETKVAKILWQHAEAHTPSARFADYTQAIMDLGATVCRRSRPDCPQCPLAESCVAHKSDNINEYPGRKPKKVKPERSARMFVLHHAGAVLLEQRPPQGIWGGLWTPPERNPDTSPEAMIAELGIKTVQVDAAHHAPSFRHSFTHYHLDIEPIYIALETMPAVVRDSDGWRWHQPGSNEAFGLSAPAVKLIASLEEFGLS
jgi:A/G-specific adenine glycosylase